uniref:Uncharacterized protein n=1 Tax=Romanomermis culicivorax TaxID=13658 RepID=A0A915HIP6_ROMCU
MPTKIVDLSTANAVLYVPNLIEQDYDNLKDGQKTTRLKSQSGALLEFFGVNSLFIIKCCDEGPKSRNALSKADNRCSTVDSNCLKRIFNDSASLYALRFRDKKKRENRGAVFSLRSYSQIIALWRKTNNLRNKL